MYAVEFRAKVNNGSIEIPEGYRARSFFVRCMERAWVPLTELVRA